MIGHHTLSEPLSKGDTDTLKLCLAGSWLHGTISGGRARELAVALGWKVEDIENLRFLEERALERERNG